MNTKIDARKLLEVCETWSQNDTKNNTAAVLLSDSENVFIHYSGNSVEIAKLVNAMMNEDAEIALNVYKVATLFAHKNFTPEIIEEANRLAKAIAEVRKEMNDEKGGQQ